MRFHEIACLLAAVLVGVAAVRAVDPASQPTSRPAQLTVATYNINWGLEDARDLAEVVKIIRQAGADVVAIQEGSDALRVYLRKELGKEYPYIQFYSAPAAGSFGWLSKYPLTKARKLSETGGIFGAVMAQVRFGLQDVQLASVHLTPVLPHGDTSFSALLNLFADAETRHKAEIVAIFRQLPPGIPTLVVGDFNSPSFLDAPSFLRSKGFSDSFAAMNKDADLQITWQWELNDRKYEYRLDYIWHSPHFVTRASRVITGGPSDHFAVVSQVELLDGPATRP